MSIPVQILALLWREPGREWPYREMTAELHLTRDQLHHPLHRLLADDRLERVGRGLYRIDPDRHFRPQIIGGEPRPSPSAPPDSPVRLDRLCPTERRLWSLLTTDRPLTARQLACLYGITYSLAQRHLDALVAYDVADVRGGHYTRRSA